MIYAGTICRTTIKRKNKMKRCLSFITALVIAGTYMLYPTQLFNDTSGYSYAAAASRISENGIALIKEFEGFLQYAKWDYKQWSIGYGTGVDKNDYPNGITEAEADRLLREVVVVYEGYVQTFLNKYNISVTQNQYDALVSFTYNLGNVWRNESEVTIRTYLINGISNYTDKQIKDAFMLWCKAGGEVLPGLLRRREREADLFLSDFEYSGQASGEKWRITSSTGVRLRMDSVTSSEIIGVIPYNAVIVAEEKTEREGFLWGKISYNGKSGWCVLDYADHISGDVETSVIPDDNNYEKWRIVSGNGVNLRFNYGTENKVLDVIPYNTVITVYEQKDYNGYVWARTEYNGQAGWCVLNYASKVNIFEDGTWVEKIHIQTLPHRLVYTAGELFDNTGMCVIAHYSNGTEQEIEDYGCSGNTMLPGTSVITVNYKGVSADFSVTVNPARGDINLNGTIDNEDNYNIKKYILCENENSSVAESGDINGDGKINIFDSMRAKKNILDQNKT